MSAENNSPEIAKNLGHIFSYDGLHDYTDQIETKRTVKAQYVVTNILDFCAFCWLRCCADSQTHNCHGQIIIVSVSWKTSPSKMKHTSDLTNDVTNDKSHDS